MLLNHNMAIGRLLHKSTSRLLHKSSAVLFVTLVVIITAACQHRTESDSSERKELDNYQNAAMEAQKNGDIQKMSKLVKEFYEVSQKGHSAFFKASAASAYSSHLIVMGKPEEGKKILDEAMRMASQFDNDTLMMEIYNGYGLYEMGAGRNYFAAAEHYLKSLEYARKFNDKESIFTMLVNLGFTMSETRDTTGLKYALEAYQLAEQLGSKPYMAYAAQRVVEQMGLRGNFDEQLPWMKKFIEIIPQSQQTLADRMWAQMYLEKGDYATANRYVDLSIAEADTSESLQPMVKANIYYLKANILGKLGRCDESNKWLEEVQDMCKKANSSMERDVERLYARNYEQMGNYSEALKHIKVEREAISRKADTDRINIQKAKEVALDVAQKDEEIKMRKEQEQLHRWMLAGITLFCLLLAGLCAYIYNMYRRQRKLMTVIVERAGNVEAKEEDKQHQEDDLYTELFQRVKELVEEGQKFKDKNLSRDFVVEELGSNRTYVSDAVKKMTGMTFPQYISKLRIDEAERILHDPNADVSNLSHLGESLGFLSYSAFQSTFKKQTGMTLSAYREIARKKGEDKPQP